MEVFEATVTSKRQVRAPARLRSALGLKSGDQLVFRRDDRGGVHVEALMGSLSSLRGIVRSSASPVDGDQIDRWIEESRGAGWRSRPTKP